MKRNYGLSCIEVPELKEVSVGNWRRFQFESQFHLLDIDIHYSSELLCRGSLIISSNSQCDLLANGWSEITVNSGLCNDMTGDLLFFKDRCLKELVVKNNSLRNLNSLIIDNAFALTNIVTEDGTYPNGAFYYVKSVTIISTLIYD